ncbi:hypothetical protein TOREUM_20686 [Tenacibaculum litoreum]
MSLQKYSYILCSILLFGSLFFLYVLIKDRIEIIRSIKPKSIRSFFGYYNDTNLINYIISFFSRFEKNPLATIAINIIGLLIWLPFWVLDKIFSLNIFEDK